MLIILSLKSTLIIFLTSIIMDIACMHYVCLRKKKKLWLEELLIKSWECCWFH